MKDVQSIVKEFKRLIEFNMKKLRRLNIALLGNSNSGKSSFIRMLDTIEKNEFSKDLPKRLEQNKHLFKKYSFFGDFLNIFDTDSYYKKDLEIWKIILDGKVNDGMHFKNINQIKEDSPSLKIDVLMFVLSGDHIDLYDEFVKLSDYAKEKGIKSFFVLTQIDPQINDFEKKDTYVIRDLGKKSKKFKEAKEHFDKYFDNENSLHVLFNNPLDDFKRSVNREYSVLEIFADIFKLVDVPFYDCFFYDSPSDVIEVGQYD